MKKYLQSNDIINSKINNAMLYLVINIKFHFAQ